MNVHRLTLEKRRELQAVAKAALDIAFPLEPLPKSMHDQLAKLR